MSDKERATSAEAQLASGCAECEPAPAKLGQALRAKRRTRLPDPSEIVYLYERQESLVISSWPTENGYEGVAMLSLQQDVVKLFIPGRTQLSRVDSKKLLRGSGAKVRYVGLDEPADPGIGGGLVQRLAHRGLLPAETARMDRQQVRGVVDVERHGGVGREGLRVRAGDRSQGRAQRGGIHRGLRTDRQPSIAIELDVAQRCSKVRLERFPA